MLVGTGALVPTSSALAIDEAPILHVVRVDDLPTAENLEAASGSLEVAYFAADNNSSGSATSAERRFLTHAGFRAAAISEFELNRSEHVKSTAIELRSPSGASHALAGEVSLSLRSQLPSGAHATAKPDHVFAHAVLLTFRPGHSGWEGGLELIASQGSYLYELEATAKPDEVSRATLEALLKGVMARA
ncbi:MAG TPA: hypothetical protein VGG08_03435 [Solirubrobacteraceae bacterium]|jgi:hypothetical protein